MYIKHEQSQQKETRPNKGFDGTLLQTVQDKLTPKEQLVAGALASYRSYTIICPSVRTLAKQVGVSERVASSAISKLRSLKLIYTRPRWNNSLVYKLTEEFKAIARPFMSSFFLSLIILFVPSRAGFAQTCSLSKDKDYSLYKKTTPIDYSNYEHQSLYHDSLYKVSELDRASNPSALSKEELDVAFSPIRVVEPCLPEEFTLEVSLRLDAMTEFCRSVEAINYEDRLLWESDVFFSE